MVWLWWFVLTVIWSWQDHGMVAIIFQPGRSPLELSLFRTESRITNNENDIKSEISLCSWVNEWPTQYEQYLESKNQNKNPKKVNSEIFNTEFTGRWKKTCRQLLEFFRHPKTQKDGISLFFQNKTEKAISMHFFEVLPFTWQISLRKKWFSNKNVKFCRKNIVYTSFIENGHFIRILRQKCCCLVRKNRRWSFHLISLGKNAITGQK